MSASSGKFVITSSQIDYSILQELLLFKDGC